MKVTEVPEKSQVISSEIAVRGEGTPFSRMSRQSTISVGSLVFYRYYEEADTSYPRP